MLHTKSTPDQKAPFSSHWPQRQKKVSLIWSSCSQTVSASRLVLVTVKHDCSCPVRDTPFGFYNKKIKQ